MLGFLMQILALKLGDNPIRSVLYVKPGCVFHFTPGRSVGGGC